MHGWCWSDRLVGTTRFDSLTGKLSVEITWRFSVIQMELARVGASATRYRERSMTTSIEIYRRSISSRIPLCRNRKRNCCRQPNESRVLVLLMYWTCNSRFEEQQERSTCATPERCRRWTTKTKQITSRLYVYNNSGAIYTRLSCTLHIIDSEWAICVNRPATGVWCETHSVAIYWIVKYCWRHYFCFR